MLQILFRAIRSYSATSNLAALSLAAPEILLPIFRERLEPVVTALASASPVGESVSQIRSTVTDAVGRKSVVDTQNAIAAACLVFAHSMADGAVEELCRLAADFDPAYWSRTVSSQTCTLGRVVERGIEDLLQKSIRKKIQTMSLPSKMTRLLGNAGKHSKVEYDPFSYDKTRLAELDALRHEIIHREGITLQVASRDSQEFFFNLTVYAGLVTSSMLGLDIAYPQFYTEWVENLKQQAAHGVVMGLETGLTE